MSNIFLDKIATSAHMRKDEELERQDWRKLLVQPVAVPNLAHTGIRSAYSYSGVPALRPDGTVSSACKRHIAKEFKNLPQNTTAYDPLDMTRRDKEKVRPF